jgi:uncharacterized protein YerC
MAKVKVYSIDSKEKYRIFGEFFEVITNLKNKKEAVDFLIGLFTPSEMLMVARRIQVAKMILKEDNYEIIRKNLKVSNQTINKVEHWICGDEEKNKFIAEKITQLEKIVKTKKVSENMLDKYSHHKFLKELF